MTLQRQVPLTVKPFGVTDTIDGTNGPPGSMLAMANLVPSMHTRNVWVPRPAANVQFVPQFIGPVVTSPGTWGSMIWGSGVWGSSTPVGTSTNGGEQIITIGDRAYGIGASNRFPGFSEPFCYDEARMLEIPITGAAPGNLPLTAPTTGEWQPPTITQVGGYVLFSHPGFSLPNAFGWLDMTGFTDSNVRADVGFVAPPGTWGSLVWGTGSWGAVSPAGGDTIANITKNGQPYNVSLAGWRPGMLITDSQGRIPVGTRIAAVSSDGTSIRLTQQSTGGITGDLLSVQGGTPANPLWSAGNLNRTPLLAPAVAIAQFSGRAWYAVNTPETARSAQTAAVVFSQTNDPLNAPPSTITNVLTLSNGEAITALTGQSYNNSTVAGGIVQALLLWQGDSGIAQVTGDAALGDLALNENHLSSGTLAPMTIVNTPGGTRFVAPDGMRVVQLDGTVSAPIGANGDGVALPFVNVVTASRMCAAYNEDVYRVSVTYNNAVDGAPIATITTAEFWYHDKLQCWSGPHSFPFRAIAGSQLAGTNHGYVGFPISANGVWFSNSRPLVGSSYTENGIALQWLYQTAIQPDTGAMYQNAMTETELSISLPATGSATCTFLNEAQEQLDQVTIAGFVPAQAPPTTPAGIWGQMIWGQGSWGAGTAGALLVQRPLYWHRTLVFKEGTLAVTGASGPAVALGNLYLRYQVLGYMIQDLALEGQMYPVPQFPGLVA